MKCKNCKYYSESVPKGLKGCTFYKSCLLIMGEDDECIINIKSREEKRKKREKNGETAGA